MTSIPLTQGKIAIVDEDDYELVSQFRWYAAKDGPRFYVQRNIQLGNGIRKTLKMHTLITGYALVDHINGDGLDNRRINLRSSSNAENSRNSRMKRSNKVGGSKYKGVYWYKANNKWGAIIGFNYHNKFLGLFESQEEAAMAYDKAAVELFGKYAKLNFVESR